MSESDTPPSSSARAIRHLCAWALILVSCILLLVVLHSVAITAGSQLDFLGIYGPGKLVHEGLASRLYDQSVEREVERTLISGGRFTPLDHPPFEAWIGLALAQLPVDSALLVWGAVNLLMLGLVIWWLPRTGYRLSTEGFLVWLAICIPFVASVLALGQDTMFLVPAFLLALLALKKRRGYAAGLALGLGLFRFEVMLPFVFILILRRCWKVLAGFLVACVCALFASVALVGWGGIAAYLHVLADVGQAVGSARAGILPSTMPTLRGAVITFLGPWLPRASYFPVVLAGSLGLAAWAAWQFKTLDRPESATFDLEFSLAVLAAMLASYHLFVHECTPLIVVGFLMLGYEGLRRREGILGNRRGSALLILFAAVFGIGGAVFQFRDFSVLFVVILGMMVWLAQEIAEVRSAQPAGMER